jgi:hypothetical protein
MTRRAALGAGIAILITITAAWRTDPGVQEPPQTQGQAGRPPVGAPDPCVGRTDSVECLNYRILRIDQQLTELQASVRELQLQLTRTLPPISLPVDPGWKPDADTAYLQQRIDSLSKTVIDLVSRVNASGR